MAFLQEQRAFRLSDAPAGQALRVVLISEVVEDESAMLRSLTDTGIHPRARVRLVERDGGTIIFETKDGLRSVPLELASKIWVRADEEAGDA
jgi:hypothetical protein